MSPLLVGTLTFSIAVIAVAIWAILALTARRRQLSASRIAALNAQQSAETGTGADAAQHGSQGAPGLSGRHMVNQPGSAAGMSF